MAEGIQEALQSEAYIRGRRDGLAGASAGLNPYPAGSAEQEQYRQGRESAAHNAASSANARMKVDQVSPAWERRDDASERIYSGRAS